jgi:hypothetical protein
LYAAPPNTTVIFDGAKALPIETSERRRINIQQFLGSAISRRRLGA